MIGSVRVACAYRISIWHRDASKRDRITLGVMLTSERDSLQASAPISKRTSSMASIIVGALKVLMRMAG
ncbi:MAG TPA: hypothetical protein QGG18_11355 [Rhodospirillales bacterium]|nr:hypothetical protein [Rhodospirillales bacterium]